MWVQAAKDAEAKCKQLEHIWFNASRHHFPAWHTQALYRNLWNAVCFARSRKIDVELIIQDCFANNRDLQRQLYKALLSSGNATYFPLYRLRSNLKRWRLQPFGDISCRRARNCLNIISKECPPRVWFAVFRAMWNGWITSRRMRTMPGFDMQSSCKLGCPDGADELETLLRMQFVLVIFVRSLANWAKLPIFSPMQGNLFLYKQRLALTKIFANLPLLSMLFNNFLSIVINTSGTKINAMSVQNSVSYTNKLQLVPESVLHYWRRLPSAAQDLIVISQLYNNLVCNCQRLAGKKKKKYIYILAIGAETDCCTSFTYSASSVSICGTTYRKVSEQSFKKNMTGANAIKFQEFQGSGSFCFQWHSKTCRGDSEINSTISQLTPPRSRWNLEDTGLHWLPGDRNGAVLQE